MSDLAPFVAATIRDKVIQEQQEEIVSLREKINELEAVNKHLECQRNPFRVVAITGARGQPVYVNEQLDINDVANQDSMMDLFPLVADLCFTVERLVSAELRIDGQCAVSFGDLSCICTRYFQCCFSGERVAMFRLEHGPDLTITLYIGPFSEEEYVALVQAPASDFVQSALPTGHPIFDQADRPCRMADLLANFREKNVKVAFEDGAFCCSPEFFFHHLQDPGTSVF